jgi:uncharacterized lipoprotein YehR (DUF1307 family)
MANKKNWLGMLVMVLVFAMAVTGCGNSPLNGTWVTDYEIHGSHIEWNFNKGRYFDSSGYEGTYTISGNSVTITTSEEPMTFTFRVEGNTLTLTYENQEITFKRKEPAKNSGGGSKVTEKNLVGVWELEGAENISSSEYSDRDEFFKDGTGITSKGSQSVPFTWRLRDGNRLQMDAMSETDIWVIELSEKGKLLTYYLDDDHHQKVMYRKK